ncbi:MAG: hypothetical protein R2706_10010 [Acidimicrobiales bacterium]
MERSVVQIACIRIRDAVVGDVVNRDPDSNRGWFEIDGIEPLHDGSWALLNQVTNTSITGTPVDIIGIQVLKTATFS